MAEWHLYGGNQHSGFGANTAASRGTTITAPVATNTKVGAAYTQLVASTPFNANSITVTLSPGTSHTGYLVDIAVGAGGSEQVIIPNLAIACRIGHAITYQFPIHIPAGSRLSARCQSATTVATCFVSGVLSTSGWGINVPLGTVVDMGLNLATSLPTLQFDPGAAANTKPGYSQLIASTSRLFRALVIAVCSTNAAMTDADWLVDIGIGGAGAEQALIPNLAMAGSITSDIFNPMTWPAFPVDIPAATRLAVNAQCSITDASDRLFRIAAYGVA